MKAAQRPVEAAIIRIEAVLPHLATKADVAEGIAAVKAEIARVETNIAQVEAKLADKPGKLYMWGIVTAVLTAYGCGLAALAILK